MLLRACHLSVNSAKLIRSTPLQPTSLCSVLITSSHLCLGTSSGVFLSGSAAKILYIFFFSPGTCHMLGPSHSPWFDSQQNAGEVYKSWSFTSCYFLQSPVTSSLLGPNTSHSTLFSNTFSLHSLLNIRALGSQPLTGTTFFVTVSTVFEFAYLITTFIYIWINITWQP